jgi:microcystin-dependent protein
LFSELPPGTILLYSGNISSLVGSTYTWLWCDGSEVSRLTYSDLFSVIGVTYGSGNGIDTFNLPDFRFRFPLGSNGSNDSQLVAGGASSHVMTLAEMPVHSHGIGTLEILYSGEHSHTYVDPGHNHGGSTGTARFNTGGSGMYSSGSGTDTGVHSHTIPTGTTGITINSDGNHTHSLQGLTDAQGLSQPIDMMPPYQTIHYIIRA